MIDKKKKAQIIKKFATHENDTGSSEVQIALLTEEIKNLTEHLKTHKKDFSSRRGLLRKVSERRKLLKYLQRENLESFEELAKKLKLKTFKKAEDVKEIPTEDMEKELEETEESES
ncbi:30S ribosomal protein S15 [Candidatus Falkowbacteria bacterium]|uniref:Small ribosomal subunit protein uS15 n=1 Tax=Candidatus Buchananbacteria bacterium CG10_big_fil_rev_8_21_14_0_10_33_19 TaxID=1974525 RepID=A0A2H0W500_9BACT|nr:30S ribosomal protein S15 [Candidatus Falkowbacteria bacterium]PIS06425.1 MAG: 30S ribosomal protein S15 [Candidatus Buchananbacteria bacterium CG10_big_fil_rev_8_21_14_0_10_33_19]